MPSRSQPFPPARLRTGVPSSRLTRSALVGALGWLCASALAQSIPQGRLPTVALNGGIHVIQAEVAAQPQQRAIGLMMRATLPQNGGMLFIFDDRGSQCMWMRNTLLALSVAFLDDDGTIVNIEDMKPRTEDSHCARHPVRYALEMSQGWFEKRGLKAGTRLSGLPAPR